MTLFASAAGDCHDVRMGVEDCLDVLGWYALKLLGMTDGASMDEIQEVLGEPTSAESRIEPEREEGVVRTIVRLEYADLDLEVSRSHLSTETPPSTPTYWLKRLVVHHPDLQAIGCGDIGSGRREIEARLGPADEGDSWIWFGRWRQGGLNWASYATIQLQFDAKDQLKIIQWEYWAD